MLRIRRTARELRSRGAAMYDRRARLLFALARGRSFRRGQGPASRCQGGARFDVGRRRPGAVLDGCRLGRSLILADNSFARIGELATVRALFMRALELDEDGRAADSRSDDCGRVVTGAARRFGRAGKGTLRPCRGVSNGESAFAYVALATGVAQPAKDRREFERLLRAALAIDVSKRPSIRLANLIAQKRARYLLSQIDKLF